MHIGPKTDKYDVKDRKKEYLCILVRNLLVPVK